MALSAGEGGRRSKQLSFSLYYKRRQSIGQLKSGSQVERKKNRKQRWLQAFKKTNQNTQEVKTERFFFYRLDKTVCEFSTYVTFNKATNGQTDINHEKENRLSWMSLLTTTGEKLPPSQRSSLEILFVSYTYLSVCRFVKGNVCRTFAHFFCLVKWRPWWFVPHCFACSLPRIGQGNVSNIPLVTLSHKRGIQSLRQLQAWKLGNPKNTEMFLRHPHFSVTHFCESVNYMYLPL